MAYSNAFSQAISILLYVHVKIENEHYEYLSTKRIAESLNIPAPTAAKVIQKLTAANLLNAKEGANGGMSLAKQVSKISLYDVFQAVEYGNPLFKIHDNYNIKGDIVDNVTRNLKNIVFGAENGMKDIFRNVLLSSLLD